MGQTAFWGFDIVASWNLEYGICLENMENMLEYVWSLPSVQPLTSKLARTWEGGTVD